MDKYYISNDIRFLSGADDRNYSPSSATHMKFKKAKEFIRTHDRYIYFKVRPDTKRGNDYVICTPMKFLGKDGSTTNTMKTAMEFQTWDAAYEYMDSMSGNIDKDLCFVINEGFSRKKRHGAKKPIVEEVKFDEMDSSERIVFPPHVKSEIFKRSNGVCALCGKPLYSYDFTVDHIIPLSRGGTNNLDNLRAVHKGCNQLKGNFMDRELVRSVSDVYCNMVSKNPQSPGTAMFLRSFFRGVINNYGGTEKT